MDTSNILVFVSFIISQIATLGFAFMSWYTLRRERITSVNRENQYIIALMSRDADEFSKGAESIATTHKQRLAALEAENDLALKVDAIDKKTLGIPINS